MDVVTVCMLLMILSFSSVFVIAAYWLRTEYKIEFTVKLQPKKMIKVNEGDN